MIEPVGLGRYYLIFTVANAVGIVASVAAVISFEFWIGPVPGIVMTGLNIGLIFAPAAFVASRFITDEGRVPSASERSRLTCASLLLSILVACVSAILLICGALFCIIGLAAPSIYAQAIAELWQAMFPPRFTGDPIFWTVFLIATSFVLFIISRLYDFTYGRLALQFLQHKTRE